MEKRPDALLLKFPGTNCELETARALEAVGFSTRTVPVAAITPKHLEGVGLIVFSGGFSYGDYVMSGRFAQLELERRLGDALNSFVASGGHVLGICNGFQILTRLGLLPEGSLIDNVSHRFMCRWVTLRNLNPASPFLKFLPETFELPIANAEGRFVSREGQAARYVEDKLASLTYAEDINGSQEGIAGLSDATGRVFGLMPHPERFMERRHHYNPDWAGSNAGGWGKLLFQSIHATISQQDL